MRRFVVHRLPSRPLALQAVKSQVAEATAVFAGVLGRLAYTRRPADQDPPWLQLVTVGTALGLVFEKRHRHESRCALPVGSHTLGPARLVWPLGLTAAAFPVRRYRICSLASPSSGGDDETIACLTLTWKVAFRPKGRHKAG